MKLTPAQKEVVSWLKKDGWELWFYHTGDFAHLNRDLDHCKQSGFKNRWGQIQIRDKRTAQILIAKEFVELSRIESGYEIYILTKAGHKI